MLLLRAFAPPLSVPKIPEGEKVDFDVSGPRPNIWSSLALDQGLKGH